MPFSAILSGVTIGASITNVSLYPCTGSTSGTCSGTVIPNYSNVAKSSLSPSLTISGITDGTTYIKLVASGGGCSPDYMLPINNIPGAPTIAPTNAPTNVPTPPPTGAPTTPPTSGPTNPPTPEPTPMFKTIQISNPQSSVEGACGVSSGLTKYISSAYSNITNGIVVYNTSSLDPNDKYLPNGAADYWPIIFNGNTYATTFASGDAGAISTVVDCTATPTYSVSASPTSIDETPTNNTITFTVTTTNVTNGTILYWSLTDGSSAIISADPPFKDLSGETYTVTINNNVGTFTLTAEEDTRTEGSETFGIDIRTLNTAGPIVATTGLSLTINDTSMDPEEFTFYDVKNCSTGGTGLVMRYPGGDNLDIGVYVTATNEAYAGDIFKILGVSSEILFTLYYGGEESAPAGGCD